MLPCDYSIDIVCVAEPYAATVELISMYVVVGPDGKPVGPDEAAIARLGVRISDTRSDLILETSPKGMSQKCVEGLCVHYVKWCTDDKLSCRFSLGASKDADPDLTFVPREFRIVAKSHEAFAAAEGAITIGLPTSQRTLTFADLQQETAKDVFKRFSSWDVEGWDDVR